MILVKIYLDRNLDRDAKLFHVSENLISQLYDNLQINKDMSLLVLGADKNKDLKTLTAT